MMFDPQSVRIDGVYEQRQPGNFMLRIKVPAGIISTEQALRVAEIADRFAGGSVHLTTRGSIELHWLKQENLAEAWRMLASVGLTTRGACGGAVRGVVCAMPGDAGYGAAQLLARRLLAHFTHNPRFEGLPKKFKIGVFTGYGDGRHLIQDLSVILREGADGNSSYDVWIAGGLGREPHASFLLEEGVAGERLIPLAEAIISLYRELTPKGKRLKHLVRERGREEFVKLVRERVATIPSLSLGAGLATPLTPAPPEGAAERLTAGIFAGELGTKRLVDLAEIARQYAGGYMVVTGEQNVLFILDDGALRDDAARALAAAGFGGDSPAERVCFRICPGNHECKMGLSPTRDVARELAGTLGEAGERLSWSICGCPNSCSHPQLADVGIATVKSVKDEQGERHPLFDLYRRYGTDGFGVVVRHGIGIDELLEAVREIG
ncbi:nitrite/sulfite reductase [Geobacter grbiciae]|uniref:nitrite/sulfite reductase n=1 Tax=Geobacter grbiciae TaxID=155042 RepID=UPI001C01A491|nr:nitrite/sulfite reductase [Geobacter grbiciae]MBT1077093.1 nitrite/sulfite reductase [Geobacter grbiciae]